TCTAMYGNGAANDGSPLFSREFSTRSGHGNPLWTQVLLTYSTESPHVSEARQLLMEQCIDIHRSTPDLFETDEQFGPVMK
ncbi:MAG: hypothetical protein ACK6A7_00705, partial [Planctomycetota bacterium]